MRVDLFLCTQKVDWCTNCILRSFLLWIKSTIIQRKLLGFLYFYKVIINLFPTGHMHFYESREFFLAIFYCLVTKDGLGVGGLVFLLLKKWELDIQFWLERWWENIWAFLLTYYNGLSSFGPFTFLAPDIEISLTLWNYLNQ